MTPKRYYKRLARFPEGIDRLEAEVQGNGGGVRPAEGVRSPDNVRPTESTHPVESMQPVESTQPVESMQPVDGVPRPQVTERQIARWVDELFLDGGMKATVGYIILRYGAWEAAMNVGMNSSHRPGPDSAAKQRTGKGEEDNVASPEWSKIGFRASWALEWAYEQAEESDLPEWFFDRLANDFTTTHNGSLHRIYAKIICDRMRFGSVRPTDAQAEKLAEKCFDLVIGPRTKTAVRFWCLEILAELAPRLDWVAGELPETLRLISEAADCSPGMRVATREILKRLKAVNRS